MTSSLLVLIGALLTQDAKATLENCVLEEGRWVCRYRLPDVQLVQGDTTAEVPTEIRTEPDTRPTGPNSAPVSLSLDPGVLTEDQRRLVTRCAAAGWLSLCTKADRAQAQSLQASATAYENTRVQVGQLLSDGNCGDAVSLALAGGYLGLAREARAFCKQ